VNCKFGCMALKCVRILWMSVCVESYGSTHTDILCSQCCWSKHQNFLSMLKWGMSRSGTPYMMLGHI
jgi:hypothetical protein